MNTIIFLCLIFFNKFILSSGLRCPVYPANNDRSNAQHYIQDCRSNCSFKLVDEDKYTCVGIYHNVSGRFFIKQLGIIPSDEDCAKAKHCNLELDSFHDSEWSCCCSTNNCTLHWQFDSTKYPMSSLSSVTETFINTHFFDHSYSFSWSLFMILVFTITFIIALALIINGCKVKRNSQSIENKPKSPKTASIEGLFLTAEQYVLGKNSIIYKGHYRNHIVALKVYQPTHVFVWTNEMMLLKSIQHPSIIKALADGQYDTHLYLVLPFYENGTLQSYLRSQHRIVPFHRCLLYLRSLASAVAYLHSGQNNNRDMIIHRDIKSSNILVADNGIDICLADFGMATIVSNVLTERDFVQTGTLRYMAPELLEGVISHTAKALCNVDIYALALVMWEIMNQCAAFSMTDHAGYRAPYDEYLTNPSDRSSFESQLYDIVVVRRLRPRLSRAIEDVQCSLAIQEIMKLIESCWTSDPDLRINAQTLLFKLNQITG